MPLFYKAQLSTSATQVVQFAQKSATDILQKAMASADEIATYDVFLSHRFLDANYVLGLKTELEKIGYSTFVDWIEKPLLDRANVTLKTANWLREKMKKCKCLLYAISANSADSKWMPWEVGYSDGIHGKVAIVPILDSYTLSDKYSYAGQEYLGLYPYVTKSKIKGKEEYELWINENPTKYVILRSWLCGVSPLLQG